jgi:hypothetical protein
MDNQHERQPLQAILQVGMTEFDISIAETDRRFNTRTRIGAVGLSQDGLGITSLKETNRVHLHVEHSSETPAEPIIRSFGYLAAIGLGGNIQFIKEDGTLHDFQIEPLYQVDHA